MFRCLRPRCGPATWAVVLLFATGAAALAQTRVVLPEGSVILVSTRGPIDSSTARVGQTFETTVVDTVRVDGLTVIPAGSRITGVITFVQAADRRNSGVIEVKFNRLTLPGGTAYAIDGRLTSTDPNERRQIESDPNARVVLVGGRGGIGAAIAGAGPESGSASGILGALGALLSEGRDVRVAAGVQLAVQLRQGLLLRVQGPARAVAGDAFTIYTSAELIRQAQGALRQRGYYRGAVSGQLDDATQRALFEFQIDQGILATGNLDGRTAQALNLSVPGAVTVLTAQEASLLRRSAQAVATRVRQELGIATTGRLDPRRFYSEDELDLWFALSAFADNASLYEQVVRTSGNVEGSALAGGSLVGAARRVDEALTRARPSAAVAGAWDTIRLTLAGLDPTYTGR